jgi:hypothetical protein
MKFTRVAKRNFSTELLVQNFDFNASRIQQLSLINHWISNFRYEEKILKFSDVAFRVFSGNGQDGILLYLLTILGSRSKIVVDIGCGNGVFGNSANLVINHGFYGVMLDADLSSIEKGKQFYTELNLIFNSKPKFAHTFLEIDNVNKILTNLLPSVNEVDVLSIDIDSIDLYILKSIDCITPRIVVLELNNAWGFEDSKSLPYSDNFSREWIDGLLYGGASLAAFNKILSAKGYWLIGIDPSGFDAYFIREGKDIFPEVSLQSCYEQSRVWQSSHSRLSQSKLAQRTWIEI